MLGELIKTIPVRHQIFLRGEINTEFTMRFMQGYQRVGGEASEAVVVISSAGGDLDDAITMHDIIAMSPIKFTTVGLGNISSGGLHIFTAGSRRIVTPSTSIGIHRIETSDVPYSESVRKNFELLNAQWAERYSQITGKPISFLNKKFFDGLFYYLTPQEAVALNLADEIIAYPNTVSEGVDSK